ncbi:COX15/CtaA family protein [Flexibacterium corallicola]|uniref:COX15/CtaA family protein n=1 Tax=Flexibacterium corallicola TaxID=3037259 RepID=UPI00286FAE03|nr:COX15/CtaA family protein [Pseudovibrio sp. M1P-2-3]
MIRAIHSGNGQGTGLENGRSVRIWLYFICLLIFGMVVVGGATRLTDSGLSITEWKPVHGVIPPLTHMQWLEDFEKYKQIPQYKQMNLGMSLEEFKTIFWWEWAHRLLGRTIGLFFFIPLVWFWVRGRLQPWIKPRLVFALALGGLQGLIGWWMVSSGLAERVDVSQYRLAVHLSIALILFAYLFYLARLLKWTARGEKITGDVNSDAFTRMSWAILLLLFLQLFMGALVAGLNAGLTFNTWPLMDGQVVPSGLLAMSPWWLNFTENVMTVQFQHRVTAYVLTGLIAFQSYRVMRGTGNLDLRKNAHWIAIAGIVQVALGVVTLLGHVPLDRALLHQGFAVVLLALCVDQLVLLRGAKAPSFAALSPQKKEA